MLVYMYMYSMYMYRRVVELYVVHLFAQLTFVCSTPATRLLRLGTIRRWEVIPSLRTQLRLPVVPGAPQV